MSNRASQSAGCDELVDVPSVDVPSVDVPLVDVPLVDVLELASRLVAWFGDEHYLIALSGGVDSAVVAKAASLSGRDCTAATADSPSVARFETADAATIAELIGLPHRFIATRELEDQAYLRNDRQRCYFCKSHLFATLRQLNPLAVIVTGTNHDDLNDYRPGLQAAGEAGVRAPLAELGINKEMVRRLAANWALPIFNKPASPCLASRIAYGVTVTRERLNRVEQAERILRQLDLLECRVRLHEDELARIEVPEVSIARISSPDVRVPLLADFKRIGFRFITLDLEGFRSGSLNDVHHIELPGSR